jgi:hypothetical protein
LAGLVIFGRQMFSFAHKIVNMLFSPFKFPAGMPHACFRPRAAENTGMSRLTTPQ